MSLVFPLLRSGHARPTGLLAFLCQPASTGRFLAGPGSPLLEAAGLSDASLLGAAVGDGFGLFGFVPARSGEPDPGRESYGLWLNPRDGRLALLLANSRRPAKPGGPGWYDRPEPPGESWHAGAGLTLGGPGAWGLSVAGAAFGSRPGLGPPGILPFVDGGAARVEGLFAAGRWRLEATISATSPAWSGLCGASSDALKVACELRHLGRALSLGSAYRFGLEDWSAGEPVHTIRGGASLRSGLGTLGADGSLALGESIVATLDSSYQPGFLPSLRVGTSWRAVDGVSSRFDVTARLSVGERPRIAADLGIRFLPEGMSVKSSLSCAMPTKGLTLGCELGTDGWVAIDTTETGGQGKPFPLAASAWASLSF